MVNPVIEVKGLVNQFGTQRVHDGLDFSVYPGEIIGVVGGSGSGKSVLMRSIIGLNTPAAGSIHAQGVDLLKLSPEEWLKVQRLWGVMFQGGALFSSLTVRENVAVPLKEYTDLTPAARDDLAEVKIEMVGLPKEARHKYPAELSGGMIKRAALARALALDPQLLFLDEPTAGLDPISASAFDTLIRTLSRAMNIAVVMITHDLDSLFTICDRIAVLVDKKIKIGTLEEMLEDTHPWIHEYFHGARARAARGGGNGE